MTVTQSQIAQKLGVNQRTVSIALGASGRISEKMRQRVLSTAQDMGYRPNHLAAGLRGGKTQSIGIIWNFADDWTGDSIIAMKTLNHIQKRGYQVYQVQLPDENEHLCKQLDEMIARRVDALVIQSIANQFNDPAVIKRLKQIPAVVAVCPEPIDNFTGDLVVQDRLQAIRQVVEHLATQGRKRPIFIIHTDDLYNPRKCVVFAEECKKYGMAHDDMILTHGPLLDPNEMGLRHIRAFNERYPDDLEGIDAIFTFNDIGAMYIMRELQQRGIEVPKQVAVVGFNDIEVGRIWQPALASGDRKRDEVAAAIKQMLDSRLAQVDQKPRTQTIHMQFICRESAG